MKITDFNFTINHGEDGVAVLALHHGGDVLEMELSTDLRRALGLNLLDPTTADVPTAQDIEAA